MKNNKKVTVLLLVVTIQALWFPAYSASLENDDRTSSDVVYTAEATAVPVESMEEAEKIQFEALSELTAPDDSKAERFVIKYKRNEPAATQSELSADLSGAYDVKSVKEVDFTAERGIGFFSTERKEEIQIIELNEAVDIDDFTADINSEYSVEYVQPDYKLELSAEEIIIPTETGLTDILADDIAEESEELSIEITEENELSDIAADTAPPTIVAVIDTGIDIEHESLWEHIYCNTEEQGIDEDGNGYEGDIKGWDFYNNSPEVYDPALGLDQAHGTHIAGVIADTAPNAKILPLKVFENGIAYTSDIIEAIQYAELMGASVVNCSWGCTAENRALEEAMEGSGMIFVCAAGNNRLDLNETPLYPACYDLDNIISVTSVNDDGGLSYFSNYGNVDIAARGRNIESCFPEGKTGVLTGTSISAAFVSGALASVYTDAEETIGRLYNTSDKLLNLQDYVDGGRRLNLDGLASNTENNDIIDVHPAEDFNSEGYSRTTEESWELFSALENMAVECSPNFRMVLKANGTVWTWGKNNNGQLGVGNYVTTTVPQQIPSLSGVVEIAADNEHAVARTNDNCAYTWGSNAHGCLGIGSTTRSNVPVLMINGTGVTGVGAGSDNTYVLKNGQVYVCGGNQYGAVGDGTFTDRTALTDISLSGISKITGGGGASFAISEAGALYSWGHDGYGRLGDGGDSADRAIPQIIISSGIADVNMGTFDCMALTTEGTVYNWGYSYGESPVLRSDVAGATGIVTGQQALFIQYGGTIKSKGFNDYGSLGVGDTSYHSWFTTVSGAFTDFDVKGRVSIAIGTNGCIYTWGLTDFDTMEYTTAPAKVSGEINDFSGDSFDEAAEVDAGETHGEITSEYRNDYYKFTPTSTGLYEIYSISSMDLVCKVYTKNSDGTYTLKFSNDDAYGSMGGNYRDFCITQNLTENAEYYIYVYPFSSSVTGDYELHIISSSTDNTYIFSSSANSINSVYINVSNMDTFMNKVFKVLYDEAQLLLTDACLFSKEPETVAKSVPGSGVNILSVNNGEILFTINQVVADSKKISGTINILQFKSLTDGEKTVRYEISNQTQ